MEHEIIVLSEENSGQHKTQERLKNILKKLLQNEMDQIEVLSIAEHLSLNVRNEERFSKQKYALQKVVLEQIVKVEPTDYFQQLLHETNQNIQMKKPSQYICCLVGCLYKAGSHRSYLQHLKRVHFTHKELSCNFKKQCRRQFSSMQLLIDHVKEAHSTVKAVQVPGRVMLFEHQACRCDMLACRGMEFSSVDKLMTHIINFHVKEERQCIFESCSAKFSKGILTTAKNHFLVKHKNTNKLELKNKHKVKPSQTVEIDVNIPEDTFDEEVLEDQQQMYTAEELENLENIDDLPDIEDSEEDLNFYMMSHANFLNRLVNEKYIPRKTVTEIAEEFYGNCLKSNEQKEKKLRNSLKHIPGMNNDMENEVVKTVINDDYFLVAQKELSTDYKREKFIRNNFKFVPPCEIILNKDSIERGESKDVVHYIPVTQSFKQLIEDKSLNDVFENERDNIETKDDVLRDFMDGSAYRNNPYFAANPGAFAAHFYSDAVELTNPLGAAKGKHKIVQVFYTVCQIPRGQRSRIDRMQLCMVFKESLVKKYGHKVIFRNLIKDMKKLEEGIMVDLPVRRLVKLGILAYSGDNLESHGLGGFSCCFSSKDICRFCHATHQDLQSSIHDFSDEPHKYWNAVEYDQICDDIEKDEDIGDGDDDSFDAVEFEENLFNQGSEENENDESLYIQVGDNEDLYEEEEEDDDGGNKNTYGLRNRSPLNQLKSFHAVWGFPPDCMHDLLEGVVAQDLFGVVKILAEEGWFKIEEYNLRLRRIGFTSYDAGDKPQEIPLNLKKLKLPGKAMSLWVHIRNFPFIIKPFLKDIEDEVLNLVLLLVEITSRITAVEIRSYEISILEDKIIEYLDKRKEVFEEYPVLLGTPKPKHHFLTHYPQAIKLFGPPLGYWTARFESKHRIGKNLAEAAKNFKNISLTVSVRQQMRMASIYYLGMFETKLFTLPEKVLNKKALPKSQFWDKIAPFMTDSDLVCSEVFYNNQKYNKGDIVVLKVTEGGEKLLIGLIEVILVRKTKVYLVVTRFVASKRDLGFFETESSDDELAYVEAKVLADFKPLIMRGTVSKFQFILHHNISFSHD